MADATNNSAAAMAMSSQPMKIETVSIPGYAPAQDMQGFDPSKYRVRYLKVDVDDESQLALLEQLETEGLMGVKTVVLNKTGWTFMDKYIMLVTYLEQN